MTILTFPPSAADQRSPEISIDKISTGARISTSIGTHFAKGCFSLVEQNGATNNSTTGVCQVVNTMNYVSIYAHLRQVMTPLNRDGKSGGNKKSSARQLHT